MQFWAFLDSPSRHWWHHLCRFEKKKKIQNRAHKLTLREVFKKIKKVAFDQLGRTPPPSPQVGSQNLKMFNPFFPLFILMDYIHFKTDFSMKKNIFLLLHFLPSPTIHSLKTVLYLLSFEAFNDGMYSTNMVSFDWSPGIQQPRCYIHCL